MILNSMQVLKIYTQMKKIIVLTSLFSVVCLGSYAQNVSEIYKMSVSNSAFSTARSAAVGGAFGSLGADLSSMNINPAGLGMYNSSEMSVTPSIKINSAKSTSVNGTSIMNTNTNKTTGQLNNIGIAYNVFNDSDRALKGLTLGFSYNTTSNNNSSYSVRSQPSQSSIADMFAAQLFGINPKNINSTLSNDYDNYPTSIYGAIGAYKTGLIFDVRDNPYEYATSYDDQYGNPVGSLLYGDIVHPEFRRSSKGTNADYNFSMGMNFNNIIYIGTTLGVSDYRYKQFDDYYEDADMNNRGDLGGIYYNQTLYQNAIAFNFNFGVTVQPVKGLRIGAAIHAPKIFDVNEEYSTYEENSFINGNMYDIFNSGSPIVVSDYKVKTPMRFIAAASYTFSHYGFISFDYERVWYNKMRVKGLNYRPGEKTLDEEIQDTYSAVNNFKAGIEINVTNGVFVRGGYGFYGNASKLLDDKYGVVKNISGGLGYRTNHFILDITYVNISSKISPYRMYSYNDPVYGDTIESQALCSSKIQDHNILLTLGFKF